MRVDEMPSLRQSIQELWDLAHAAGLDPLPTHFEVVPATILFEIAAYGLPGRFSHWAHGKAYHLMKRQYEYGLMKYFELVVHSDPAQAFLLESNDLLTNKFVVAHVLGHTDFFHHNAHFCGVDRGVADRAVLHAQRLRAHAFAHGVVAVEGFLESLLALEEHVDPWAGPSDPSPAAAPGPEERTDLLLYLWRHAPKLSDWQRDALAMVREEALYFRPQLRTKIMNVTWWERTG